MHFDPRTEKTPLPFDPFKSLCVPRPIGWISTVDREGRDNLAPYSQFQNLTFDPPMVMFAANLSPRGERKHSAVNAEETGWFVWNMATWALREAVNVSAMDVDAGDDEFARAGLEKAACVEAPGRRVAASPCHMECEHWSTLHVPGKGVMGPVDLVIGRVARIHIADDALTADGKVDILKLRPIARMGYYDYTSVTDLFEMKIPPLEGREAILDGLEGRQR